MSVKGSVTVEVLKLIFGKSDPVSFALSIAIILATNPVIIMELRRMEAFYIPEGMLFYMIAVMATFGILTSIAWAQYLKKHYKHEDEKWKGGYLATMFMNMILAPIAANMALSIIVQSYPIEFNPYSYLFLLVLMICIVSLVTLATMNFGPKWVWEAFKKNVTEPAGEIKNDIISATETVRIDGKN